jgi:anti-anti-sigma factor
MLVAEHYNEVLIAPASIDAASRLDFRRAALEHLERVAQRNGARLVIELRQTTAIDASGLGVLVLVQKRARERMIAVQLLHPPAAVMQMIALTKLEDLFEIAH